MVRIVGPQRGALTLPAIGAIFGVCDQARNEERGSTDGLVLNPSHGRISTEECFASLSDAEAAGYRAS